MNDDENEVSTTELQRDVQKAIRWPLYIALGVLVAIVGVCAIGAITA